MAKASGEIEKEFLLIIYNGLPDNLIEWIYKVAKYKAVTILNRKNYKRKYASVVAHHLQSLVAVP